MNKVVFILILCSLGCKEHYEGELVLRNHLYCKANSSIPFSGVKKFRFEGGSLSSEISFRDGIPQGREINYGYEGEIINQGTNEPILTNSFLEENGLCRINIERFSEADLNRLIVFAIPKDSLHLDSALLRNNVAHFLKKEKIIFSVDSAFLFFVADGELEK